MKSRTEILAIDDFDKQAIEIPEWQTSAFIRNLPIEAGLSIADDKTSNEDRMVQTIIGGLVDANGQPIFEAGDAEALKKKNPVVLMRISKAIGEFTLKLTKGAIETEAKN